MAIQAALAVLAALTIIGGAGAAAVATGAISLDSGGTINLGALSPGMNGTVTVKSTVNLNSTTHYKFEMEKEDQIGSAFSTFQVYVTVNGTTYNLSDGNSHNYNLTLSAGSHTFTIIVKYTVRNVEDSINATKVPFLFLHAAGFDNSTNDVRDNLYVANDNINSNSNSGTYALAYLSFTYAGNKPSHSEDSGTDNALSRAAL